jgi:hypothetical protein
MHTEDYIPRTPDQIEALAYTPSTMAVAAFYVEAAEPPGRELVTTVKH